MKNRTFSVFGFYADNNERACFIVKAVNPNEAEDKAVKMGERRNGDFRPVAVFGGKVQSIDTRQYTGEDLKLGDRS